MSGYGFTVQGYDQLQAANQRAIAAMQPSGALGRAVMYATQVLQQAAIDVTPVDTGTLRASHLIELEGLRGRIYIAPRQNPKRGGMSNVYGPTIHSRGGRYAFYGNAFDNKQVQAGNGAIALITQAL